MKEGKNNTVLLTIIGIATLLIAVVGATFAYFTAQLTGQETNTTMTINSGTIGTVFEGGASIVVYNIYPRAESWATKTFTIKGDTETASTVNYVLALVIDLNTFTGGVLKYTLTADAGSSNNGTMAPEVTAQTGIPSSGSVPLGSAFFQGPTPGEVVHTYNLSIYFPDTGEPQNDEQGAELKAHVDISAPDGTTTTTT